MTPAQEKIVKAMPFALPSYATRIEAEVGKILRGAALAENNIALLPPAKPVGKPSKPRDAKPAPARAAVNRWLDDNRDVTTGHDQARALGVTVWALRNVISRMVDAGELVCVAKRPTGGIPSVYRRRA